MKQKFSRFVIAVPLLALAACGEGTVEMSVKLEPDGDSPNYCYGDLTVTNNGPELIEYASVSTWRSKNGERIKVKNVNPGESKTGRALLWCQDQMGRQLTIEDFTCRMSNQNCKPMVKIGQGMSMD